MKLKKNSVPKGLFVLLESFFPLEWNENTYTYNPPFMLLKANNSIILAIDPLCDPTVEQVLSRAGVKLSRDNPYFLLAPPAQKTLTTFDWFVRRSWRRAEYATTWSMLNLLKGVSECNLSIEQICERSGLDRATCVGALNLLDIKIESGDSVVVTREKILSMIEGLVRKLPSWVEESVMDFVCSNVNVSAADVHSHLSCYGLSPSMTYKLLRKLKSEGCIKITRHLRVKSKGPMREMMSSDCRNCFFGYSTSVNCFKVGFHQLERLVERLIGRPMKMHEVEELYQELSKLPFSEKTLRSVNKALILALQFSEMLKEKGVVTVLRKMGATLNFKLLST
ncbi:MAG: hypothetical protein RMJ14_00180 [Nitrososphaerota archaeon]|nr:hypothetical protein [Nitrososphaerota archaeon]